MKHRLATLTLALACGMLLAAPVRAQEMTENDVISGTMNITFNTRTNLDTSGDLKKGSAAIGAKDEYKLDINVAKTTDFQGTITRQPKLFSSILGRTKQDGRLYYDVNLGVRPSNNLQQKLQVGKWVGEVPLDPKTGIYELAGGKANDTPLRIAIEQRGAQAAFVDPFVGKLLGKAEKKEALSSRIYNRVVGGKTVKIEVKKADPMKFQGIELSKGPAGTYPRCTVNGQMDFDYETSNWLIPEEGVTFTYNLNGKEMSDKMTGSIKWVEDPNYSSNGKGYYDFNLRFNEEKSKPATTEDAAFAKLSDEDAFFVVDTAVPALNGRIEYVDSFVPGTDTVASSKVTYHLHANKLNKQQVMNFFKLWLICVGPTNDD